MLGDMLARLSNTIADEDPEIQSFSMEILTTLKTIIVKLEPDDLLSFPQLFWTTCACLESINEREFLEAVEMLNKFLTKLDLSSPNVRRILADGQPSRWEGIFEGVQPLLHKGLRSSLCWQPTLDTIDKLVLLPSDGLVGDDRRLFFSLLANFPRFLNELEKPVPEDSVVQTARLLQEEADNQGLALIAEALDDFAMGNTQDSSNSLSWVKIQTMRILCAAIPEVDMRKPELAGHGSDLISPLLRLLQTEFCMEALEVLDNIMTMSGNHMDKHHLRMSMTRPTSKAIRKEYERTQSLFGIPEASGWAIPVPAKKTDATRANIHAAFYTCQGSEGMLTETAPTPDVEFHADDFPYNYFGAPERTETMLSDEGRGDVHAADLATKLDSLDDFFDEPSSPATDDDGRSSRTITEYTPESFETGAELYDEQTLPILHEASNNTSFQNGFADRSPGLSREASSNTMTPGAFSVMIPPARPGLHSRSITSPSAPASYQPQIGDIVSDDEYLGGYSDADDERPGTGHTESAFYLENMIKPVTRRPQSRIRRVPSVRRDERSREKPPPRSASRLANNVFPPGMQEHAEGDML
jgi:hypothetical protein